MPRSKWAAEYVFDTPDGHDGPVSQAPRGFRANWPVGQSYTAGLVILPPYQLGLADRKNATMQRCAATPKPVARDQFLDRARPADHRRLLGTRPERQMSKKFEFHLAPLEDTSDSALRELHGATHTYTEMARFDSLAKRNRSTWEKVKILNSGPTYVQIVGQKESALVRFLDIFKPESAAFAGINFNFGCPSPQLIRQGLGAAMIKRISKTQRLVDLVKSRGYSCSIKLRLGLNRTEKEHKAYIRLIESVACDFFVIHARTADQTYENPADYSVFADCVRTGKRIIANGDVATKEQLAALIKSGVAGVMIGRAAVRHPAIFNELQGLPAPTFDKLRQEYSALATSFGSTDKYRANVLPRIGKPLAELGYAPASVQDQG